MIKLQKVHKVSAEAIGEYVKPYSHYKSGFDKMRSKNKALDEIPETLDEFSFDNFQEFTVIIDKKLFLQYDNKSKSNRILIFASDFGIKLLGDSHRWQSDGTFFCAPKPFTQAYYIMGGKPNEKLLPCVYVLQMKRDFEAYNEVFHQLKHLGVKNNVSLNPKRGLTDFESAARKALKFNFPGIQLKGCYFHFKQAIGRWIFKHSYKKAYINNLGFKKWFRKLAALACVPLDQINEAFDLIQIDAPGDIEAAPILNYFRKTWLEGQFPSSEWNQYGDFNERTNNSVEAYNKQVNTKLKVKPKLLIQSDSKIVQFLIEEENKMRISLYQSDKEPYYDVKRT